MALSSLEKIMVRISEQTRKNPIFLRQRGNLHCFSRHAILDDLANDLLSGIEREFSSPDRIIIFCGLHKSFGLASWFGGFRIGIQTEHYYDETGNFIGRKSSQIPKILKFASSLDAILEINPNNRPMYDGLPDDIKRKIVFEPSIFPASSKGYSGGNLPQAVFFGSFLLERRQRVLAKLGSDRFCSLDRPVYGDDLLEAISDYRAVLNIHVYDGVYTEAPRVLLSLKAGKPLISERLSSEWTPGVHYILPENFAPEEDLEKVYTSMAELCCGRYSFQGYLERVLKNS